MLRRLVPQLTSLARATSSCSSNGLSGLQHEAVRGVSGSVPHFSGFPYFDAPNG